MTDTVSAPTKRKRIMPLWAWFVSGFLIFLVLALVALRFLAGSSIGRNVLENQIERLTVQGQTINFEGLKGDLLDRVTLDKLILRDEDGIWAEASDIILDWSPYGLAGRKLNLDLFEAGAIEVYRRPILPPSEKKNADSNGEFPLKGIRLNRLNIKRVALSEGVVPQAVAGSIAGDLSWTSKRANLNIQLEPEDQNGDRLVGHVNWTDRTPIKGDIELNGPAGGLFATLLRLEPDQELTADFSAEGEMSAITANLIARIDGQEWLNIGVVPDGELHSFIASADLTLHPDTLSVAQRLGPKLDASGELDLQNPLDQLAVVAETQTLLLDLSDIRSNDGELAAQVSVRSNDPDAILQTDAVSLAALALQGDVSLIDGIVLFDGAVQADRVRSSQASIGRVAGPVSVRYGEDRIELTPDLRADALSMSFRDEPARIDWLTLKGEANYDLNTSRLSLADTEIRTDKSFVRATGNTTVDGNMAANVKGDVRINLNEFGLYEAGIVEGRWAAVRSSNKRSRFEADLKAVGLAETEALYEWLGEQVSLKLNGELTDDGAVNVPDFRLTLASGALYGNAQRGSDGEIDATASFLTGDSYPLVETLPGAQIELKATGPVERLVIAAKANAANVNSGDFVFDEPNIAFDGLWSDGALTGETALSGRVGEDPVELSTEIRLEGSDWALSNLRGGWRELVASGGLTGSGGDPDEVTGQLKLVGNLPEDLPAKSVDLDFYRQKGDLRVAGKVLDINTGPLKSSDLTLDVSGSVDQASYDLELDGLLTISEITQKTNLSLTGNASDLLTDLRRTTGELSLVWGQEGLATREPFTLQQSEKGVEGQVLLSVLDGNLDLTLSDAPDDRVNLRVGDLTLRNVMQALGRAPVEGQTEFELKLVEQGPYLVGTIRGEITDLALPDQSMTPVSFLMSGEVVDETLMLELVTPESQALGATIDVELPVETAISPISLKMSDRAAGQLEARLLGKIDNIMALVLADQMSVKGSLDASFSSAIPFEPAGLTGKIVMADGYFEHGDLGAVFQDINFTVNVSDQLLSLDEFSAHGRKGGTLTGRGSMGLVDQSGSNIAITADKLVVVDRREGRAVATGTLGLEVEDDAFVVNGDLTLDEGQIYIDRLPTSSGVTTLDVQFPVEGEDASDEDEEARAVRLDIALKAPRRLQVNGSGMDAEMSLDSRITGSVDNIQINGESRIVRGRFELLGKRFTFAESVISFAGDPMQARLDIEAQRTTDDFLAKVLITGTPERPSVTLDAEPSLPEDEVLSRVLFGRSPSQLTGLEAARLAAALAAMGGGGGFDLMGGIESIAGLDTFDVSQDSSGQFQVATGRYLSEDVYLEVTSNATGSPGVSVEWEPRENISVGAETVPGEGQNLSIQWKRDFD